MGANGGQGPRGPNRLARVDVSAHQIPLVGRLLSEHGAVHVRWKSLWLLLRESLLASQGGLEGFAAQGWLDGDLERAGRWLGRLYVFNVSCRPFELNRRDLDGLLGDREDFILPVPVLRRHHHLVDLKTGPCLRQLGRRSHLALF